MSKLKYFLIDLAPILVLHTRQTHSLTLSYVNCEVNLFSSEAAASASLKYNCNCMWRQCSVDPQLLNSLFSFSNLIILNSRWVHFEVFLIFSLEEGPQFYKMALLARKLRIRHFN